MSPLFNKPASGDILKKERQIFHRYIKTFIFSSTKRIFSAWDWRHIQIKSNKDDSAETKKTDATLFPGLEDA
jgi:hypothetical protein